MTPERLASMADWAMCPDAETHLWPSGPGYRHGKLCTKCGSNGPFPRDRQRADGLHSQCKECHRLRAAANRKISPAKKRAAHRAQMQRWREANPDKVREIMRRWIARHPEAWKDAQRRCVRAWTARNPDKAKIYRHRRRARIAGAGGKASVEQVTARMAYYGFVCAYCGGPFQHVDHVIPLAAGGSNWPANLRPACASCNLRKHTQIWWSVRR